MELRKEANILHYKMVLTDWLAIIYMIIIAAIGLAGWWLGDGVLSVYPILETMSIQGREWFYLFNFHVVYRFTAYH